MPEKLYCVTSASLDELYGAVEKAGFDCAAMRGPVPRISAPLHPSGIELLLYKAVDNPFVIGLCDPFSDIVDQQKFVLSGDSLKELYGMSETLFSYLPGTGLMTSLEYDTFLE